MTPLPPASRATRDEATRAVETAIAAQPAARPHRATRRHSGVRHHAAHAETLTRVRHTKPKPVVATHQLAALQTPATTAAAPVPRVQNAAELVANLRKAGFTISASGDGAIRARGMIPGHPLPVNIVVPKDFNPKNPLDLALHLHGFTLGQSVQHAVFDRFDFGSMAGRSGFKGLTIVPESADKDATFNAWNRNPKQFTTMMSGLSSRLESAGLSSKVHAIALSGHSGAYASIAGLLSSKPAPMNRVSAVGLFDSSYGSELALANGAKTIVRDGGLFMSVNIANSGTDAVARAVSAAATGKPPALIDGRTALPSLPTHGGVFYSERSSNEREHHWQVFARRYDSFLSAFSRRNP